MRRLVASVVVVLLALSACRFNTSRQLAPGDVRGRLVVQDVGSSVAVAGARISVEGSRLWTRSDASGRFVLRGLVVGRHVLNVEADTDADGVTDTGRRLRNVELSAVSDRVVAGRDLGDVVLGATGGIEGTVKLGDALAPGAEVVLDGQRGVRSVDGSFVFERLLPGEYTLSAAVGADGAFRAVREVEVPVAARERTPAELRIDVATPLVSKGRAQGRVLLPSGDPATGGEVLFQRDGAGDVRADVDVDGLFDTGEIAAGRYDVLARLDGYLDATYAGLLVTGESFQLPDLILATADASCGLGTTLDGDADGLGDACDTCPDIANPAQRPPELSLELRSSTLGCTAATFSYAAPPPLQRGTAITPIEPVFQGDGVLLAFTIAPALPEGLDFDPATGRISGTPTVRADAATYTVTGANFLGAVTATVDLVVRDVPPSDLSYTPNPASFALDQPITPLAPTFTGGLPTTFTVLPALPDGLALDGVTGVISGTPTDPTSAETYVVTASNDGGSATASLVLDVKDAPPVDLAYPQGTQRFYKSISAGIDATFSGGATTRFAVTPPLPSALTLDLFNGHIGGLPQVLAPAAAYVVRAENSGGFVEATVTLEVVDLPPDQLAYPSNAFLFTKGTPIAPAFPTATGGPVVTYTLTGALPAGLTFGSRDGQLSGTPTELLASRSYTVTATNTGGSIPTSFSITVRDVAPSALSYATPGPTYTLGVDVIPANMPTSRGGPVVSYAITPPLPAGLTFSTSTGAIAGRPSVVRATATNHTITATNTGGFTSVGLPVRVIAPPPTAPQYTPSTVSTRRKSPFTATNLQPLPATHQPVYSVLPALPPGLTLDPATGHISGTPTGVAPATTYTVSVATPSDRAPATTGLSLTVFDDPPTALVALQGGTVTRGSNFSWNYTLSDVEDDVTAEVRASTSTNASTCATSGLVVATNLAEGTTVARTWPTAGVPFGAYRFCISSTDGAGQLTRVLTTAVVNVQGPVGTLSRAGGDGQTVAVNGTPQPLLVQALNGTTPIANTPIQWTISYPPAVIAPTTTVTSGTGAASFSAFPALDRSAVVSIVATATEMQGTPSVGFTLTVGGDLVLDGTGGSTDNGVPITSCAGGSACDAARPYVLSADRAFANVTLRNSARLEGTHWSAGPAGPGNGVLRFTVSGTLDVDASSVISMDGAGFTGSAAGLQGSTTAATGIASAFNNGPAGGGGLFGGDCLAGGSGGGGGGHELFGDNGLGPTAGRGGGPEGSPDVAQPSLGGGGGGGSGVTGGTGGHGGGAIVISAGFVRLRGTISTNGLTGNNAGFGCDGGGGGGAGGSIRLEAKDVDLAGGLLRAERAAGGNGAILQAPPGHGGKGSHGRIRVSILDATPVVRTLSFTSTPRTYLALPGGLDATLTGLDAFIAGPTTFTALRVNGGDVSIPAVTVTNSLVIDAVGTLTARGSLQVGQDLRVLSGTLAGPAWTSGPPTSTSGLLDVVVGNAFEVAATSVVTMEGAGYPGGDASMQGIGQSGALGITTITRNGAGGGGGASTGCNSGEYFGGGGGGHATLGSNASGPRGGQGGSVHGDPALVTSSLGGGGGGGAGERGGAGGGAIRISAALFTNNGLITANGFPGDGHEQSCTGGGGGGAGGSIRIETPGQLLGSGTVTATGGEGGIGDLMGARGGDGYLRLASTSTGAPGRALAVNNAWHPTVRVTTPADVALTVAIEGRADFPSLTQLASLSVESGNVTVVGHTLTGNLAIANEVTQVTTLGPLTVGGAASVTFGAALFGPAWSGGAISESNGILRLAITGALTVDGSSMVSMTGRGYSGGAAGFQGSSEVGPGAEALFTANGSGGGAGDPGLCVEGMAGGGGGGHVSSGSTFPLTSDPGVATGSPNLTPFTLGGGGGGSFSGSGTPYKGGSGGGMIFISAASMVVDGALVARGEDGEGDFFQGPCTVGAGGGAGGAIRLSTPGNLNVTSGTVSTWGGAGGMGSAPGGSGSDGRIRIDAGSVTGNATAFSPFVGFCNGQPGRTGCGDEPPNEA